MQEIWKDVKGYEGLYQISNLGNVRSLNYNHMNFTKNLKPILHHSGYYMINLLNNGYRKRYLIHRLVAETFLNNFNNYPCVNHKDEDKTNNCVDNLEFCSQKYNSNYDTRNFRISKNSSKSVNQYDLDGNFIKTWKSITEISKALNISMGNLSMACNEKYKTTHGYIWRYAD